MSVYTKWFVMFFASALASGIASDAGHTGLAMALGSCAILSFAVILALYLDSGDRYHDKEQTRPYRHY